jgi:hypothetical protein
MQLFKSKKPKERPFRASRFKLPSEEFFRTAIVVSAIAVASVFAAGNYGVIRDNGIRQRPYYASISQITDYASRHPLKSTIFMLADVAALAAFSLVYYGALADRRRRGLDSD